MKTILFPVLVALATILTSCKGGKDTPESVAKEWCSLLEKMANAETEEERDKAIEAMEAFSDKMEEKYKDNEAFLEEVEPLAEECEEEIEGRMDENGGNEDYTDETDYSGGGVWTQFEQENFMTGCVAEAVANPDVDAEAYCRCMLDKVMVMYPNSLAAEELDEATMTDMALDCI